MIGLVDAATRMQAEFYQRAMTAARCAGNRHLLDARGTVCPEPIRLADETTSSLKRGQYLDVLATDLAAPIDFEAWCMGKGHQYLGCLELDEWLRISIRIGTGKREA